LRLDGAIWVGLEGFGIWMGLLLVVVVMEYVGVYDGVGPPMSYLGDG
jgi:hypothetical protein